MPITYKTPPAEFTVQIKDGHGRILYAVANQDPENSQKYNCKMALPSGETFKETKIFREAEVLPAMANWLNSKTRQFERDREHGDRRTRPTPVFAGMPPTDSPHTQSVGPTIRYGERNVFKNED